MSPSKKAAMAFKAMGAIGISEEIVRPVLKNLLRVYDKNWELIEEENYRVLADAIFDLEESKVEEEKKKKHEKIDRVNEKKEVRTDNESQRPCKRLRFRHQEDQASPSQDNSSLEEADLPQTCPGQEIAETSQLYSEDSRTEFELVSPQVHLGERRKEPVSPKTLTGQVRAAPQHRIIEFETVSPQTRIGDKGKELNAPQAQLSDRGKELYSPEMAPRERRLVTDRASRAMYLKEPKVEHGIVLMPKENAPNYHHSNTLIKPKSEPVTTNDIPQFEVPIAIIRPSDQRPLKCQALQDPTSLEGSSNGNDSTREAFGMESMASQHVDGEDEGDGVSGAACQTGTHCELANIPEESLTNFEIASTPLGEVKISLSYNSVLEQPNFHMPSLDAVLKLVEDKCLKSYRIIEPNFSVMKLMKDLCQCVLELGTDAADGKQERLTNSTPEPDLLEKSNTQNVSGAEDDTQGKLKMLASPSNGSLGVHSSTEVVVPKIPTIIARDDLFGLHRIIQTKQDAIRYGNGEKKKRKKEPNGSESSNSRSMVLVPQHQFNFDDVRPFHDVNDISKGEENIKISLINEITSEQYPPTFYYIPQNIVYQNARVNISLTSIADINCCSNCFGDCMSSSIPCACARETGGDFAYTLDGLVKEEFLDECISMNRDPQRHHPFYCKVCPLERSKNEDMPDPCKGHLARKFIKECWSKCGCNKQCGNRVVQRGITLNLQVFYTSEGKGWGLRTLEDLPRGAFVCEYVGEILTNTELYERNIGNIGNEKPTYPVLLDADWGSDSLKDEDALSLDPTFYGNVARFINHRCFDANLVEIPVEVETPDHHYYHLAFFTTREVDALEELTWDYGIDFDDNNYLVKHFQCHCGSKNCRNMKRSNRAKTGASTLR